MWDVLVTPGHLQDHGDALAVGAYSVAPARVTMPTVFDQTGRPGSYQRVHDVSSRHGIVGARFYTNGES